MRGPASLTRKTTLGTDPGPHRAVVKLSMQVFPSLLKLSSTLPFLRPFVPPSRTGGRGDEVVGREEPELRVHGGQT